MTRLRSLTSRRRLAVAATLTVATLALSACSAPLDFTPVSASAEQQKAFPEAYAQQIDWQTCDENYELNSGYSAILGALGVATDSFRCAMIDAPVDWNEPALNETIKLAVVHVPSTGDAPLGTLLTNPGGPGASGLQAAYTSMMSPRFNEVMAQYDLLGFDPRGIGRSTPVTCDSNPASMTLAIAECVQENSLTQTMGTSQVARDMDLLRHLMSDDVLNYLGYSYGTVLGGTYSTLFPEKTGRMVLDSGAGAEWTSLRAHYNQSFAAAHAISDLVSNCSATEAGACPVADESLFAQQLFALNDTPLLATDGTKIDKDIAYEFLVAMLYQPDEERTESLTAIARALNGEQSVIDTIANDVNANGAAIDLAGTIVRCHSFPATPDVAALLYEIEERGVHPLLGDPSDPAAVAAEYADLSCYALPESGNDLTLAFSGSMGDDESLVIGITGDHATPYDEARALAGELGTARLLTLQGDGHAASFSGRSTCIDDAVIAYLLTGALPKEGTVCTDD